MLRRVLSLLVVVLSCSAVHGQIASRVVPPLPSPSGNVVTVSTVSQLQAAVTKLVSGTTILINPGTYALTRELWIRNVTDVALRGSTTNRGSVTIIGSGMNTLGAVNIAVHVQNASRVQIANLSIGRVRYHPIQLHGESATNDVHLYNVRLFDSGQQLLKGSTNRKTGVARGLVEYSVFEYSSYGPQDGYTNGIDVLLGTDWVIRYNLFRNIRSQPRMAGPAVLMWRGSKNTETYSNTFINCERAINYGLAPDAISPFEHEGGRIYNNFVYRAAGAVAHPDAGISVWDSPGTQVRHNTVILNKTYRAAFEARFATTTSVVFENNLSDGAILLRDGAKATQTANVVTATPSLFVSPTDLHLKATAVAAIDKGVASDVSVDWDGQARDRPDLGADEVTR